MNREIKFRAWGLGGMHNNVDVVEGKPYRTDAGFYEINSDREIDNGILMQYTGLKDKNGVEIYEGDVVKSYHNGHEEYYNCEVKWEEADAIFRYIFRFPSGASLHCGLDGEIEVIGNIHQNPELLNS